MGLIGIDEVGRGCWAGPLLVVAVRARSMLPKDLTDSKLLTKQKREAFIEELRRVCDYGEGWVSPAEIDKHGLTEAMRLGVARALEQIGAQAHDEIVMDGNYNYCAQRFENVSCIVKADTKIAEVSAASILAKVMRDDYMAAQGQLFPGYGFEDHVGYGTAQHINALQTHGITNIHRKSYKPIKKIMKI